jgi:hypothetical protein
MPARRTTAEVPTSLPRRAHRGSPETLIILGVLILGFWVLVTTLQTQTNEAFINGTQQVDNILQPQWSIWLQLPKLFLGDIVPGPAIKASETPGVIVGWGVEIFFLALIAGFEIAMHSSSKLGHFLGAVVRILSFVICIFDFYSDATYGNVSPTAHACFAIFCSLVVGFGLTWGLALVEHGWKRL